MTLRTGTASLLVVLLGAGVVVEGAKIKTRAEADKAFDFRAVKTWAWQADGGGDVIIARSADDDPAVVKKRVDPAITAAVARELNGRGLTVAAGTPPDLAIHYYLIVTVGMEAQVVGQFLSAVPEWGVPPFSGATQSLEVITRGALVLDAVSTTLGRVVWRGVAQTDIDTAQTDAKRDAIIGDTAHELVKRIPLKK
jgi:hypothetical protein